MRKFATALALLFLVIVPFGTLGAPAHADGLTNEFSNLALRTNGQLLRLVPGSYRDLFPEGTDVSGETPVLALEIAANEGPPGRLLVPGTENVEEESQPLLLYDDTLDSAVLLWRCATSENSFRLDFTTLEVDDGALVWSEIFSVESEGVAVDFTVEPFLAPTRDMFTLEFEEGLRLETRQSTIHLFWHQGDVVRYTGLSFLEGVYTGGNETLDLTASFLRAPKDEEETENAALPAEFEGFLEVTSGSDDSTLLVTFANAATARLGTLALRAVPLLLSALGDSVRQEILDAADLYDSEDIAPFREKFGTSIVIIGSRYRLHPAITDYLAREMDAWILEHGAEYGFEQFTVLAEDARDLAVDLTSSVYASTEYDPFDREMTLVEIHFQKFLDDLESTGPSQFLYLEERSNLAPPEVAAVPRAITSADGENLLLVWPRAEGGLDYLESRGGAPWGEPRKLMLSEALDAEQAYTLLRQKIR